MLVPDLFYRAEPHAPYDPATAFTDPQRRGALMAMLASTTQDMTVQDTGFLLAMLADEGLLGPVGTVGYCFGGGRALNAAAAYPERIKAAASFQGGNLASDHLDSPHTRLRDITGQIAKSAWEVAEPVRTLGYVTSRAGFMSGVPGWTAAFRPTSPGDWRSHCGWRKWIM